MISVVIPVYNRPGGAHRAIRSVFAQQGIGPGEVEVIVVDDASQPALALEPFGGNVRLVRLDRNAGAAGARNAGIRAAQGEFIAFLDSDDVWLPTKLADQMATLRTLEKNGAGRAPALNAVVCGFYCPNRFNGHLQSRMPRAAATVADFVRGCWFCPGSALVIRRSAFAVVGELDDRLRRLEDFDWFVRFGRAGGQLHTAPTLGCVIAPSYSGASGTIDDSARLIEAKFGQSGAHRLRPDEWRLLQAYLALERGAALWQDGANLQAARQILTSFWRKPRLHAAVGPFWDRSNTVPADVAQIYAGMIQAPR